MKKNILVAACFAMLAVLTVGCFIESPLLVPFGKWENTELGLVLDIDPTIIDGVDQPGGRIRRFPGTYWNDGERIDVVVSFTVLHTGEQDIRIFRYSDRHASPVPMLFIGFHQVRDNHLYLTGVFDDTGGFEIVLELIEEYEVS